MKKASLFLMVAACLILAATTATASINMAETIYNDWFFLGDFHTYDYASKVDFYSSNPNGWIGGVKIGTNPDLPLYLDWAHTLPSGLMVPPDQINRAKLWIDGELIDQNNNTITIEGTVGWDPLNHKWWTLDNTTYWLTDVSESGFWNDGTIDVRVTAGEWSLRLDESILMMDYTSNTPAVPEPGTLMLLGSGLLGLGALRFRRKK